MSVRCCMQETLLWRGRMPWTEQLGVDKDANFGRQFFGGGHHAAIYSLPGTIVSPCMCLAVEDQAAKR